VSTVPGDDRFATPTADTSRDAAREGGDARDGAEPALRVVLLDVNGTLTDTSQLAGAFEGVGAPGHLAQTWLTGVLRDGIALTLHGDAQRFADVALAGARSVLHHAGLPAEQLDEAALAVVEAVGELPLHPDVLPGLQALRELGLRLVPLSQGAAGTTDRLLAAGGAGDLVEGALSVADAPGGLWKPAPGTYAWALDQAGVSPQEALLVAVHPWDVDGAARAGLTTAWVDMPGPTGALGPHPGTMTEPDLAVPGVDALADLLR